MVLSKVCTAMTPFKLSCLMLTDVEIHLRQYNDYIFGFKKKVDRVGQLTVTNISG